MSVAATCVSLCHPVAMTIITHHQYQHPPSSPTSIYHIIIIIIVIIVIIIIIILILLLIIIIIITSSSSSSRSSRASSRRRHRYRPRDPHHLLLVLVLVLLVIIIVVVAVSTACGFAKIRSPSLPRRELAQASAANATGRAVLVSVYGLGVLFNVYISTFKLPASDSHARDSTINQIPWPKQCGPRA